MSIYAVRKHRGAWAICDKQKPVMLLESYEEALEVAHAAAEVLVKASQPFRFSIALTCGKADVREEAAKPFRPSPSAAIQTRPSN
jgi:hypothetical protein